MIGALLGIPSLSLTRRSRRPSRDLRGRSPRRTRSGRVSERRRGGRYSETGARPERSRLRESAARGYLLRRSSPGLRPGQAVDCSGSPWLRNGSRSPPLTGSSSHFLKREEDGRWTLRIVHVSSGTIFRKKKSSDSYLDTLKSSDSYLTKKKFGLISGTFDKVQTFL